MTDNKKIVFSCFLIFAVLACAVFSRLLAIAVGYFDFYVYGNVVEIAVRLIPIGVGIGVFVGLYHNVKSYAYMSEVVAELKKVTWSQTKEVQTATIVVIIAVLIAGVILGVFDSIWSFLIRKIITYGG